MSKVIAVAKYIESQLNNLGKLKMLKLVYIAYGIHLDLYGKQLFENDFEAWDYGPVVRELYNHYNKTNDSKDVDTLIKEEKDSIDYVIKHYSHLPSFKLVSKTHEVGSPWYRVYEKGKNNIILDADIKQSFEGKRKLREMFNKPEIATPLAELLNGLSKT